MEKKGYQCKILLGIPTEKMWTLPPMCQNSGLNIFACANNINGTNLGEKYFGLILTTDEATVLSSYVLNRFKVFTFHFLFSLVP